MVSRIFIVAAFCVGVTCCGMEARQSAKRTLAGIPEQQVLIAAQHVIALEGLDVEKIDFEKGVVTSVWDKKLRRMVQYEVQVLSTESDSQGSDAGPDSMSKGPGVVIIVTANESEKIVGGWSEPVPVVTRQSEYMLDDIVELAVSRFEPGATETVVDTTPKCSSSADCAAGEHCGSGKCVAECASDGDCGSGLRCDGHGRCIPPEPEPCPEVAPAPVPEPPEEEDKKSRRRRRRSHDDE